MKSMMMIRAAMLAGLLLQTAVIAGDAPATRPAVPDFNGAVLRLWPKDPPATRPFEDGDKLASGERAGVPIFNLGSVQYPSLMVFPSDVGTAPRPAVVICPGGGYGGEAMTHEGIFVAKKFAAEGVMAFVLRYRLPHGQTPAAGELPVPQQDVMRALQLVRSKAGDYNIDPKRIGICGFSAGGHLAATAATMFDEAQAGTAAAVGPDDAVNKVSARPDFAVLVYPVIAMSPPFTHGGSRANLLGKNADAATEARFDASQRVTPNTPPLFIVHAADDKVVPIENADLIIAAARKNKVPYAMVLLSHGGHGFGLGENPEAKMWMGNCLAWLRGQKLLD